MSRGDPQSGMGTRSVADVPKCRGGCTRRLRGVRAVRELSDYYRIKSQFRVAVGSYS
jgi:hypothetical protein